MVIYIRKGRRLGTKIFRLALNGSFWEKILKGTSRIFRWPRKKSLKILLKRPDYICFALGMFFIETGKMTFNPFVVPFAVEYIGNEVIKNLNSHCTVLFADAVKCSKLFATTLIHI